MTEERFKEIYNIMRLRTKNANAILDGEVDDPGYNKDDQIDILELCDIIEELLGYVEDTKW